MKNIRQLTNASLIYTYDQLSVFAKEKARQEIISLESSFLHEKINDLRCKISNKKLNHLINNRYHIRRLINNLALCQKLKNDQDCCEKFIESNLCQFTEGGEPIAYILKC